MVRAHSLARIGRVVARAGLGLSVALALVGCNVQKFAADSTVKIAASGAEGFNGFWDYEIFGAAVPSAILQSEALVRISPDNQDLLAGLARSYLETAEPRQRGGRQTQAEGTGDDLLISRQALHAFRLSFRHPVRGDPMEFEAPLPADMENTLAALRKTASGGML